MAVSYHMNVRGLLKNYSYECELVQNACTSERVRLIAIRIYMESDRLLQFYDYHNN